MVLSKTEYQKQFRSCASQKGQSVYQENLTLRCQRRDRQFLHTPICWGEQSDDQQDLSDSNENLAEDVRPAKKNTEPEPQYKSLAEIIDHTRDKNLAFKRRQREADYGFSQANAEHDSKNICDSSESQECKKLADKSLEEFVNAENKRLNEKLAQISIPDDLEGGDEFPLEQDSDVKKQPKDRSGKESKFNLRKKGVSKKKNQDSHLRDNKTYEVVPPLTRPRRPERQAKIPRAKSRPTSAVLSNEDRPPFLAYGSGDIESSLSIHRTHNVRCPADVYAPALKAKQRLQEGKKLHKEKIKRVRSAESLMDQLSAATPRDNIDWRSEYSKQFHVYDSKEYERALSSRAVISHAQPIRAVHRGGCLIVHVE